jgi:hypothetical protein
MNLENQTIYCIRCKQNTDSSNPNVVQTANGRYRIEAVCDDCGSKKSKFVSNQIGQGLLGKLLNLPGGKVPLLGSIPLLGDLLF